MVENTQEVGPKENVVATAHALRRNLKQTEEEIRSFVDYLKSQAWLDLYDKWECIANAMLSLRHLEDSRMRLGKVIQYAETGESPYDQKI